MLDLHLAQPDWLNLGGARTALFNWLFAQAYDGTLILRSEDIDQERSSVQAEESIMADLAWLGISWDEGPDKEGPYSPLPAVRTVRCVRTFCEAAN